MLIGIPEREGGDREDLNLRKDEFSYTDFPFPEPLRCFSIL